MLKRWSFMVLCVCIAFHLTGCQGGQTDAGVYLQEIAESDVGGVYNPLASYRYRLLHYGSRVYTSSLVYDSTDKDTLPLEDALGKELAVVSGNHGVYWSKDGSELTETTHEGTVYQVNGYDEDFRVAVYYENEIGEDTFYYLVIFDHLNDIYLDTGSDLFGNRLHLNEAVRVEGALYGGENPIDLFGDTAAEEFLAALYDGTVLDVSEDAYALYGQSPSYTLSYYDSVGLTTELIVYESGYAVMEYNGNEALVVKLDDEKCKALMEKL